MVRRLERHPIPELATFPNAYRPLRDKAMHALGIGTTHEMRSVITGVFLPTLTNREYTLRERVDIWRGKWSANSTRLWNELVATDVTTKVSRLELPAYLLHGAFNLTVSYELARSNLADLDAPIKGFYTFERSPRQRVHVRP